MKLIKASYEIITHINGEEILKQIEIAARTCYQSEGLIEYDDLVKVNGINTYTIKNAAKSARILIPKLMSLNHEAMLEFGGNITVKFICDRGVSHELVRHRLCSFAQESTRYCNYGKDENIQFVIPVWSDLQEGIINDLNLECITNSNSIRWALSMYQAEDNYLYLININKWSPQQARSVLPNSLKTEINMSANIREWRTIFKLRTAKAAHPQMRELMCPLLDEFKAKIPILFDDITY